MQLTLNNHVLYHATPGQLENLVHIQTNSFYKGKNIYIFEEEGNLCLTI